MLIDVSPPLGNRRAMLPVYASRRVPSKELPMKLAQANSGRPSQRAAQTTFDREATGGEFVGKKISTSLWFVAGPATQTIGAFS
jgi:hypothetical protein